MSTAKVNPIPEGMHTVTPHLICHDADAALDFYKRAIATHVRDVTPADMQQALKAMYEESSSKVKG